MGPGWPVLGSQLAGKLSRLLVKLVTFSQLGRQMRSNFSRGKKTVSNISQATNFPIMIGEKIAFQRFLVFVFMPKF
jgi:hypothetical protein